MGNARDKTGMIEFVSRTMSETILMFFQKVSVFCAISHQISNFPGNVPIKIKLFFHVFFPMGQKNHPLFAARSCSGRLCVQRWCWTNRATWAAWPRQRKLGGQLGDPGVTIVK